MSILSHQSAVNPTQNFWGTGSGVSGGVAVVSTPSSPVPISNLAPDAFFYFPLFDPPGAEFPIDVTMGITINFIFDGNQDFDNFTIGMDYNGVVSPSSAVDLKISKGIFGVSLVGFFTIPANTPVTLQGFVQNTTSTSNDLNVDMLLGVTNVISFVPP